MALMALMVLMVPKDLKGLLVHRDLQDLKGLLERKDHRVPQVPKGLKELCLQPV